MHKFLAAVVVAMVMTGCIEIAHVDSFISLPKDAVSFGASNKTER